VSASAGQSARDYSQDKGYRPFSNGTEHMIVTAPGQIDLDGNEQVDPRIDKAARRSTGRPSAAGTSATRRRRRSSPARRGRRSRSTTSPTCGWCSGWAVSSERARGHLRVLDGDGNVTEFASVEEENEGLRAALSRAEKVIRNLRAELQDNRAKARKKYPIDLAWTDWQDAMVGAGFKGKAKCKLSNDRIDAMAGIFEAGYTLADFKLAILGLAANPVCDLREAPAERERG
jgi:hypothetical protein